MVVAQVAGSWSVEAMAALIGLALLVLLGYSLFTRKEVWDLDEEGLGLLARLKKRRDSLLRAIKDMEFERESGAISEEEYRGLRNDFKRRAIGVTKDLDRVRKVRLRNLVKNRRGVIPSERKRVESLVRERVAARTAPASGTSKGSGSR